MIEQIGKEKWYEGQIKEKYEKLDYKIDLSREFGEPNLLDNDRGAFKRNEGETKRGKCSMRISTEDTDHMLHRKKL
jgi:hypothetical protein